MATVRPFSTPSLPSVPTVLTPAQMREVYRVETRLDELTPAGQTPTLPHAAIYEELREAAADVLERGPRSYLYRAAVDYTSQANATFERTSRSVIIPLPADFIRFVRLQLHGWSLAVDVLGSVEDPAYQAQANPFAGASQGRPLATLIAYQSGRLPAIIEGRPTPPEVRTSRMAIEAFPVVRTGRPVVTCRLVREVAPELMPPALKDAMWWEAAARLLSSVPGGDARPAIERAEQALAHVE